MRIRTHFAKGKYGPANLVSAPPQRLRSRSGHRNAEGVFSGIKCCIHAICAMQNASGLRLLASEIQECMLFAWKTVQFLLLYLTF